MKLQWDPSFSVGHEAMDLQHRSIFMLIEELREQDGPSLDAAQRQAILSSLTEYTLKHFAQEEALLEILAGIPSDREPPLVTQ